MSVEIRVNGDLIRRLDITNVTQRTSGTNTYRWVYTAHDGSPIRTLLSAKQGELEHVMEDGAMALISKVAQQAAETEE
ncbi:hypothetical protein [Mycolicibacterium conceptionense]|uniref:hypothetical protein n=1 Tax=Mycolicibacterium conceptionense TaxID=451644 RepID=UPI00096CF5F9|nr:hypothetical protein [Mycolicibacterium conceptionense]OMB79241.1 hypothetical protein A5743_14140 [Mycolicibacterium conceptionense]